MALTNNAQGGNGLGTGYGAPTPSAANYTSLADLLDGDLGKPDNRSALIKTFGDQGITGFLKMVGATKAQAVQDDVTFWEEGRLHAVGAITSNVPATGSAIRTNDVVLIGSTRAFFNGTAMVDLTDGSALTSITDGDYPIIGNLYEQGSDQGSAYLESGVTKRTNSFMIMKETYAVSGSQATNIGWVDLGGGEFKWYLKSEGDTRKRFIDKREMMLLLGQESGVTGLTSGEGYFAAIEDRGLIDADFIGSMTGNGLGAIDSIIVELDKQGANSEYAMYVNRAVDLAIDDMVSGLAGEGGLANAYGAFNNDKNMAVELGFKSFGRGGYTFHKHDWKLLNDPTLLGASGASVAKGVMIPMAMVADAKTGDKSPALELNYKASNGYSREMEHWLTGSVLGAKNGTVDAAQFNYRTECNLITRAANRHVLLK
jgi:hypothetical protein